METNATEMAMETMATDVAFESLIERIGHGLARGLADALRELKAHIESETRRVGEAADVRLNALQTSVEALTEVVTHQNEFGEAVQIQCRELREADDRQAAELDSLRSALHEFHPRVDTLSERLDRQADALRSMYATYSQRESELEQVVEGLVRLRSHPVCAPAGAL